MQKIRGHVDRSKAVDDYKLKRKEPKEAGLTHSAALNSGDGLVMYWYFERNNWKRPTGNDQPRPAM